MRLNHIHVVIRTTTMCLLALCIGCSETSDESTSSAPTGPEVRLQPQQVGLEVQVTGGRIRGVADAAGANALKQYHGIPYAGAPVGALRWAPTAPLVPWAGVLDASKPGLACVQPKNAEEWELASLGGGFYGSSSFAQSEDCLTLNVWTRAATTEARQPVMVWIHGGSLTTGSGSEYSGDLLTAKGAVLVTINYRLGRFGFFSHPELSAENRNGVSGNQGLRDQITALIWVQNNIRNFGGDPNNVTIFGESAGSYSTSLLQASPLARGHFHRVIGQSGGAFHPMGYRSEEKTYAPSDESLGEQFGKALAGEDGDSSLSALRKLPSDAILAIFNSDPAFSRYESLAIVDGEVIPKEVASIFADGEQADVPVLIGSNADEGTALVEYFIPVFGDGVVGFEANSSEMLPEVAGELKALYPAGSDEEALVSWENLFADLTFTYPMRTWARNMARVNSNAYLYWFTWQPPIPDKEKYRAFHAAEIGYVFGELERFDATPTQADFEFSDTVSEIWVRFAKTGNPNGEGLPVWPAFTVENEAYLELGPKIHSGSHLRMNQLAIIEKAWAERRAANQTTPH